MAPELLPVPPSQGGAIERWIRDAAVCLAGRGHELHVVARDHGDGKDEAIVDGVHYHFVRIPPSIDRGAAAVMARGLWYYAGVRRRLSKIRPDVVHHHSRPAGLWLSRRGAPAARQLISLHSMEYGWAFGYGGWDRRLFHRGLAAADRVVCVSRFIERHVTDRFPGTSGRTLTVYNGVDGAMFRPRPGPLAAGAPTVLYVGRVEERKGVHVLLEAFERIISPRLPAARLRIVGPHSYWNLEPSPYYTDVADRCARHPRIELRGPTYVDDELAGVYRDAAVSVVPSVFPEALGLTSIEAQASGVPVVVSDAGGLPETVSPGESGLVCARGNVEQLAAAVVELLTDEPRRMAMATKARAWAMAQFSWDVIAARLEEVYETVLAQSPEAA